MSEQIMISTLNGSVGTIDIQNKLYKGLIRSHADHILDCAYNQTMRYFVTIALDRSVRLWDAKNKMSQCYEFQCLDEQPTVLCSYHHNHCVLVGFKRGIVRLFDIHNFVFVKEFKEAEADILKIRVAWDDQFFVVAEANGSIIVYDGQGEYRRTLLVEFETENFVLELDYYNQSLLCSKNPYTLYLFSAQSWEIKQKLSVPEGIKTARFSYLKDKIIVLTEKGKLKFFLASFTEILFIKDFGCTVPS